MADVRTSRGSQLGMQLILIRGSAVLVLDGDLDAATVPQYAALVSGVVGVPGLARLEVDGRALEFVDSAGVHALMASRAGALLAGVGWFLVSESPALQRILDLAGVGPLHDASMN